MKYGTVLIAFKCLWEIDFELFHQHQRSISKAEVISATALDAAELDKIKTMAESKFDSKLEVETKIDEDLLGGFMINVGNKRIDLSLKSRLEALTATAAQ